MDLLEVEVPKRTGKKASCQTVTISELFSNHMKIFSVYSWKNPRPDMDSTVHGRHKKIFNRVGAYLFPSKFSWKTSRASSAVLAFVTDKFIYLEDEQLDPASPVHCAGGIWCKTLWALDDEVYNYRLTREKKINTTCAMNDFSHPRQRWRHLMAFWFGLCTVFQKRRRSHCASHADSI